MICYRPVNIHDESAELLPTTGSQKLDADVKRRVAETDLTTDLTDTNIPEKGYKDGEEYNQSYR